MNRLKRTTAAAAAMSSASGNVTHTPYIPQILQNSADSGTMITSCLSMDMIRE